MIQLLLPGFGTTFWRCFGCSALYVNDQPAARACLASHGTYKDVWAMAKSRWQALGIGVDQEVEESEE